MRCARRSEPARIRSTNQQDLSKALYGALNWQITDQLELSAGLRRIQQDISFHTGAFYPADIPPGSITAADRRDGPALPARRSRSTATITGTRRSARRRRRSI